jgi:hypothetical protein
MWEKLLKTLGLTLVISAVSVVFMLFFSLPIQRFFCTNSTSDFCNNINYSISTKSVSQLENDSGFITDGNEGWDNSYGFASKYSELENGKGVYMQYQPNGVACTNEQILIYESSSKNWVCGNSSKLTVSGNGIELIGNVFSLELSGNSLSLGSSGLKISDSYDDNFLTVTTGFAGDASGTFNAITINDDSHNHTGSTISGLGVTDFTSSNISQWMNDSGYISDGNTGWDNSYGFITDGNANWDNTYGFLTAVNFGEINNGAGIYMDYRPNGIACTANQILIYDSGASQWICADIPVYSASGEGLEELSGVFSLELDGSTLTKSATGLKISDSYDDNFLTVTTGFSGDVTGNSSTIAINDDSHNHTGATISGLGVINFTNTNISEWVNDSGYITDGNTGWDNSYGFILDGNVNWDNSYGFITGIDYSQVINGSGVYMDYQPNGVTCTNNQILVYETSNSRWVCGDVQVYSASGNGIEESLGVFSLELDGSTLSVGASGIKVSDSYDDNFLTISTNYGGDVSGTYDNITIVNDSHSHTGTTISGLGVTNFSSPNISQWTNDANYISDGNTGWDNLYGFITDGNVNWDNSYGFVTGVTYSQLGNGSGVYMDYRPNNVACSNDQILVYETANSRWVCGTAANNFLTLSTVFSGDVTGTYNTISVTDDSHNHTGTTISGLGVGDFTSANISQWTNDSGYYNSSNDGSGSGLDADLLDGNSSNSYLNLMTILEGVYPPLSVPSFPSEVDTQLTFNSPVTDTLGGNLGSSIRLPANGIYYLCGRVTLQNSNLNNNGIVSVTLVTASYSSLTCTLNQGVVVREEVRESRRTGDNNTYVKACGFYRASAIDRYVSMCLYQNTGATLNMVNLTSQFGAVKLN